MKEQRTYLMRRLDLVGSACSISVFLWAKTFLIVFASLRENKPTLTRSWVQQTHNGISKNE